MVYDMTSPDPRPRHGLRGPIIQGPPGYAIHKNEDDSPQHLAPTFPIYEDDGAGNGDFVCMCYTPEKAREVAIALDAYATGQVMALDEELALRQDRRKT